MILVKVVKYTCERFRADTRTRSIRSGVSTRSKMYVPAGSVTPGRPTGPLNVRYIVLFALANTPADNADNAITTTAATTIDLGFNMSPPVDVNVAGRPGAQQI